MVARHEHAAEPQLAALGKVQATGASDGVVLAVASALQRGMTARIRSAPSTQPRGAASVAMDVDVSKAIHTVLRVGRVRLGKAPCAPHCTLAAVPPFVLAREEAVLTVELRCGVAVLALWWHAVFHLRLCF